MPTQTFDYTAGEQTFVVPSGITSVLIECWGAQGGVSGSVAGGLGGYIKGRISVTPGETLTIIAGQNPNGANGGYGGATGGVGGNGTGSARGGGGSSEVRRGTTRLLVGAGGGGAGGTSTYAGGPGGAGGGTSGTAGTAGVSKGDGFVVGGGGGGAGTQTAGGSGGAGSPGGAGGTQTAGGAGGDGGYSDGGGGGGGWWSGAGGGAGQFYDGQAGGGGGGGGGSSYAVAGATEVTNTGGVRSGNGQVVVDYSAAPNAPTNLSPASGTLDRTSTQRFSWTFSDPNAGDSQSKYDLRYRLTGATAWTVVTGTTPNSFHDFSAGTFLDGDYEWQVRTYDAEGLVGPYSSSAFFTAATPPAGPTITDPINGQTVTTETYTVAWSYPSQQSYQLRTVADAAGAPDPATVYSDSGEVVSASARTHVVAFPVNGRVEHVQLRVKDGGLWSAWVSVKVTVSYTVPATPTVAVDATTVAGALLVQASHPTPGAGQPTVTHVDVYRRVTASGGDGIRVAKDLAPTALYTDWGVASGVEYGYRVRAWGDNGTSSWSAWSETPSTIDVYYGGAYA